MASYRLLSYQAANGPRAGLAVGDDIHDVAAVTGKPEYATVRDVLRAWDAAQVALAAAAAKIAGERTRGVPLAEAHLLAPILEPAAIYCAGANYADHVNEMNAAIGRPPEPDPHTLGLKPWHFIKVPHAVIGPGAAVTLPPASKKVDWEVELAAVIGRRGKDIPATEALGYVAGYTVANDLSARDLGTRPPLEPTTPFFYDWVGHKNFDGSCPLGPWIVPAAEIADPQRLGIKLWVNDVIKQDSNTANMIFTLAEQIAQISSRLTLHPGDIILTGTPAGVGAGRGEFLKRGDVVKLWCEGIGTLTHTMA